jgi:tetraacyldisaccharide 4'-kinase
MTAGGAARRMLLPLTPLYRFGLALRERRLRSGREPIRRLRFPVVSIGNLSTGGAGKTPFAIALAKALTQAGFAVDVLSRGFGRQANGPARVRPDGTAAEFGDEPLLIAREAGVPVYVAAQRYDAGLRRSRRALTGQPRIHILDDAFQHRQLHRDIDILLSPWTTGTTASCPPETSASRRAAMRASVIAIPAGDPGLETDCLGSKKVPSGACTGKWTLRKSGPFLSFCAIVRPDQFFAGLEAAGLHLAARVSFRDHHPYAARDLERLQDAARAAGAAALVTTAKDLVRLTPLLAALPPDLPLLTAGLRIEIQEQSAALDWLVTRLNSIPLQPPL